LTLAGRLAAGLPARLRAGLGAAALLALAACTTVPKPLGDGSDGAFARVGRFAISVTYDDGKQDAVQGGFAWRDDGLRYRLDLTSPLGSTQARVDGEPGLAVLTRSDGRRTQAADPDALVDEAMGSPVPVSGLRYWMRGRLPEGAAAENLQRDDQGRPLAFTQNGWSARLSRYDDLGPQLLVLQRGEAQRQISVRLVVDAP
jgi:outer membrane lipoprotein LolB